MAVSAPVFSACPLFSSGGVTSPFDLRNLLRLKSFVNNYWEGCKDTVLLQRLKVHLLLHLDSLAKRASAPASAFRPQGLPTMVRTAARSLLVEVSLPLAPLKGNIIGIPSKKSTGPEDMKLFVREYLGDSSFRTLRFSNGNNKCHSS